MKCPLCSSSNIENIYDDKNSCITNVNVYIPLSLQICNQCGFVYNKTSQTDKYKQSIENAYKEFTKNDFFSFPNQSAENIRTLKMIIKHLPKKEYINILEIGSNRGDMLYMIKENVPNANVIGIDPTKYDELCVPTIHTFFNSDMLSKTYDVVILQHVLEHMKDPFATIQSIKKIIRDNGILYIEVPDLFNSLQYCVEDFTLEHINYFSLQTLADVLSGFHIIESDTYSFLRIISKQRKQKYKNVYSDIDNIKDLFKKYSANKNKLINLIKQTAYYGNRIIFYGISYYFTNIYNRIKDYLNKEKCFYYDDNYNKPEEPHFFLPRVNMFAKGDLVIICSTNFRIQESIEQKLINYPEIKILRPWFSCTTVK